MPSESDVVAYLDALEKKLQQARGRVTKAKNDLLEAIEELNELQMSLNQERIRMLKMMRSNNA